MELTRWKCHKEVGAVKIKEIKIEIACSNNEANILCGEPQGCHTPEAAKGDVGMDHNFKPAGFQVYCLYTEEGNPFMVSDTYIFKHHPQPGGYYVVYADGYVSYSPAQAFEEGYTKL